MGIALGVFHLCIGFKTKSTSCSFFTKTMPMLTSSCSRNVIFQCNRIQRLAALCSALVGLAVLSGCSEKHEWNVPHSAFDARVPAPLNLRESMRNLPGDSLAAWQTWNEQTGIFGAAYAEDILRIGNASRPSTVAEFQRFITHPDVAPIESAIDSTSGAPANLAQHEADLIAGIQRFHYFFPKSDVPQIVWLNSGFNYAVYPTPTHLGVGLEWFLGSDHPIVGTLAPHLFPQYMRNRMQPERITPTALRGWLLVHFSDPWYRTDRCVDELLYWGKVMFILEQCLPDTPPHMLFDWTAEDFLWAEEHERDVWLELQPQDVLFSSDRTEFGRWFAEGPFTKYGGIPQESPDRLGAYMGWRMVQDFMQQNPELSFGELMAITEYHGIVKAYRPE